MYLLVVPQKSLAASDTGQDFAVLGAVQIQRNKVCPSVLPDKLENTFTHRDSFRYP